MPRERLSEWSAPSHLPPGVPHRYPLAIAARATGLKLDVV